MNQKLGKFLIPVVAGLAITAGVCEAQSVRTHHVRDAIRNGQARAMGRLPSNQVLQLDLVLQLRDQAGLESYLKALYDPTSPSYRHFLTPQEFTARFGPTQDDYDTVVRFAKTYGFQVVGGSRDSMDVQVKGSVANIEAAFHVNMRTFRHPAENRDFFGPDSEPTLDLPFNLWHISGLDNYSIPHALFENRNDFAQANGIAPEMAVSNATTGSGPSGSFLGSDMRVAYYGAGPMTGAGQSLGLLEYYGTDLADLKTYFANVGQPDLSGVVSLVSTDGTSTTCLKSSRCDDTEQTLDMTQALGMAPGLSSLVVYVGSTDTAMIGAMTTHNPLPGTIGCSWGWTPVDPTTLDPYFEKMAAQGQNFFVASGDSSTWKSSNYPWPAEDANVVTVGGTDLVTTGAGGAWSSETAWVDSGGGISPHRVAIPAWQKLSGVINSTNKGSTTYRNGPDVSANANFTFYVCADQTSCTANTYGGTSFAAPMWAAYIALVNQQLVQNSQPPIGFINPTIYAQNVSGGALTAAYSQNFHDITSGTSGSYSAVKGYDLVTGWGSPNNGLFSALTGAVATSGFTLTATPVSIVQGTGGATTVTSTPFGGYDSTITLSVSSLPSGVTFSYGANPFGPSGSTTINFTASASAATGTSTVTVTGTGGDGTIQTATFSLTVTAAPSAFTISANPTTLSVKRGSSGKSTITSAVTLGSVSSVALSASGQKSGTTISFSPSSISGGNGNSTMTVSASRRATTGKFSIVVKGTGGGTSQTVTIALTVN